MIESPSISLINLIKLEGRFESLVLASLRIAALMEFLKFSDGKRY